MKSTKIDWVECTLNPVVGCKHNCKYCYARKQNGRFHWIKKWDEPQFFPERLKQLKCKKSKSIFMDSMSDLAFYEDEWLSETVDAMQMNPQHRYIFLTKNFKRSHKLWYEDCNCGFMDNCWIGESFCGGKYEKTIVDETRIIVPDFLSVEPILAPCNLFNYLLHSQKKYACDRGGTVIIGAETGNRKGKVIPQKEWVDDIVRQCDKYGARVFMKSSLKKIMGDDFRQDKLPWEIEK